MKGWVATYDEGTGHNAHVIPKNDLHEHEEIDDCLCQPLAKFIDGNLVIIHNSFDAREVIEEVNDLLNAPPKPNIPFDYSEWYNQ